MLMRTNKKPILIYCCLVLLSGCLAKAKPTDPRPTDQITFVETVEQFQSQYNSANGNELQQSEIGKNAVEFLDNQRTFTNWVGTVASVNDVYGDIVVKVHFQFKQDNETYISGANIDGYIKGVDPVIAKALKSGDKVRFTGFVKRESSITASGAIENPELAIEGTVTPYQN